MWHVLLCFLVALVFFFLFLRKEEHLHVGFFADNDILWGCGVFCGSYRSLFLDQGVKKLGRRGKDEVYQWREVFSEGLRKHCPIRLSLSLDLLRVRVMYFILLHQETETALKLLTSIVCFLRHQWLEKDNLKCPLCFLYGRSGSRGMLSSQAFILKLTEECAQLYRTKINLSWHYLIFVI